MEYLKAFLCGGILCAIGQILIDKTKLTPARILVAYVVSGVVLGALGVYQYAAEWGGAGATVPLTGFGYSLAKGVQEAVAEDGLLGALTGGITATAGGITAAIFRGYLQRTAGGPGLRLSFSHRWAYIVTRCFKIATTLSICSTLASSYGPWKLPAPVPRLGQGSPM